MICVSGFELEIIMDILNKHVKMGEVRAFGSRYKWTNKDYSDLDIAIVGDGKLSISQTGNIQNDFDESDLPFSVDVLDYHAVSDGFRRIIDSGYEVIYRGK